MIDKLEFNEVQSIKDLGVIIDYKLTFSEHVDSIVSAANELVGLIRRSVISLDKKRFAIVFKSLVRSQLEYNNAAWCTYTKNDIKN